MKVIILAGGGGTRLFPLSRKSMPKQFLTVDSDQSLLGATITRFREFIRPEDIVVVTNEAYVHHVKTELSVSDAAEAHIVLEPAARNTAPAIALAARYITEALGAEESETLFVSASDHVLRSGRAFEAAARRADEFASLGYFVTFGVRPTKPETGFGYIETGDEKDGAFIIKSFTEKPDAKTAEKYFSAGNYFWNSGMFAFSIKCCMEELTKYAPDVINTLGESYDDAIKNFKSMPDISIDYAVAEKSSRGMMLPLNIYWNDVGSWDAIYDVLEKDADGNAVKGDAVTIDCRESLIFGRSRLIAGIGLRDVMIVETDDVILVAQKGESQRVKELVETLKKRGRKEATEHTTLYYEWGSSSALGEGKGYRMKKLTLHPGGAIGMRMHYHRSVHWVVTRGTAEASIGGAAHTIHTGESVYIPQTTKYSLKNPGRIPLIIIEVENGDYLGDDDLVEG